MPLDPNVFRPLAASMAPVLSLCTCARERKGKTQFSLTAPGPIGFVALDRNAENVAIKAQQLGKTLHFADFTKGKYAAPMLSKPDANFHKNRWKAINDTLLSLAEAPDIRSIVIDTGTQLYEDIRMALLGKLTQVMPHQYGQVNDELRSLIQKLNTSGKHLIVTHKYDKEYKNDKWDGKSYERKGWKDMAYQCQINLRHECEMVKEDREEQVELGRTVRPQFCTVIEDCNQNPLLKGLELYDDESTFFELATRVYPDADPELFID